METAKIVLGLSQLSSLYNGLMQELINTYHFDGIKDVRVNLFKHCRIVIDSTYVILIVRQDNLFNPDWWERMITDNRISSGMTQDDRKTFAYGFDQYVASAYITMLLFGIESEFRLLYADVLGKNPPYNFSDVYKDLLREFDLDIYKDLLKLASNIRNTLHNSGRFTRPDDPTPWRNKTYQFKKGQFLAIDYWETFIIITEDILVMLEKLIKSPDVIRKQEIRDSSYDNI